jgi:hypothetical protein
MELKKAFRWYKVVKGLDIALHYINQQRFLSSKELASLLEKHKIKSRTNSFTKILRACIKLKKAEVLTIKIKWLNKRKSLLLLIRFLECFHFLSS